MAVRVVVFDVGETLVDETGMWTRVAEAAGVTPFTLMAALGATIALGRRHDDVWRLLGIDRPAGTWTMDDWYPDARACISRLRSARLPRLRRRQYAVVRRGRPASRASTPSAPPRAGASRSRIPRFFARVVELAGVEPGKIAYVGDRVDNDVAPAIAAGMVGVHIRRGPWGHLQEPPAEAIRIDSLDELPAALP